jgi:ATP-binding cassette subfamily F protein 3
VLDALRDLDRTVDEKQLRDHLALFLFCGDDVDKPVAELSGGEKQRLSLARLLRSQFDLLCMDEPTNHLDVAGTEGLEQALKEYPGTVVLITHDRRLVEEVADRVLWVENGAIRTFERGLEQCLRVLAEERSAARAAETEAREKAAKKAQQAAAPAPKAIETGRVRNPLMFQKLEERIMALEEQLKQAREAMMLPENYASMAKMKELQGREATLQQQLAEAYQQWENWQ